MARKDRFMAFEEAAKRGPYDEFPMLSPGFDPQIHVSRNDRPQPFHLICEHDTVLVNMSGEGRVEFPDGPVRYHPLMPGDFVYIPGGTAHRILPDAECVQLRYRAEHPGLEAVAWFCELCEAEISRDVWNTETELPQEGYLRACKGFNADQAQRTCGGCGHVHPEIDLSQYSWEAVAVEIREDLEKAAAKVANAG
jgi:mannose-6-phosphate isomerase-like protein (cupin superfamily)